MLVDLTEENILKEFANVPKEVKDALLDAMGNREFSLSDLANIRKGKISQSLWARRGNPDSIWCIS